MVTNILGNHDEVTKENLKHIVKLFSDIFSLDLAVATAKAMQLFATIENTGPTRDLIEHSDDKAKAMLKDPAWERLTTAVFVARDVEEIHLRSSVAIVQARVEQYRAHTHFLSRLDSDTELRERFMEMRKTMYKTKVAGIQGRVFTGDTRSACLDVQIMLNARGLTDGILDKKKVTLQEDLHIGKVADMLIRAWGRGVLILWLGSGALQP